MKNEWIKDNRVETVQWYAGIRSQVEFPSLVEEIENFEEWKLHTLTITTDHEKEIKRQAFRKCVLLETAVIGEGITKIGEEAFRGCEFLRRVTIPASVKRIESRAFADCIRLKEVTFSGNRYLVQTAGNAFERCFSLDNSGTGVCARENETVDFGHLVVNVSYGIAPHRLAYRSGMTGKVRFCNETFGDPYFGIVKKGYYKVVGDYGSRELPGQRAGYRYRSKENSSMREIEITADQDCVGEGAYCGCRELETVIIREGVRRIKRFAFAQCSRLKTVYYPAALREIEPYAFAGCLRLTDWLPLSPEIKPDIEVHRTAFGGCFSMPEEWELQDDYECEKDETTGKLWICGYTGQERKIRIPERICGVDVGGIRRQAFAGREEITHLYLPEGITDIEEEAFAGMTGLKTVRIPGLLQTPLAENDMELAGYRFCAEESGSIDFEDLRVDIAYGADGSWIWKDNVTGKIEFSDQFMQVSRPHAARCRGYYRIHREAGLEAGQQFLSFSRGLFKGDAGLEVLIIFSCGALSQELFNGCRGLKEVQFVEKDALTGKDVLAGKDIRIGEGCFAGCSSLSGLTGQERIAGLGKAAFRGCEALKLAVITEKVTEIPANCFEGCTNLSFLCLPPQIRRIGERAFAGSGIQALLIAGESIRMEKEAFADCGALVTAAPGKDCGGISRDAFRHCGNLHTVILPKETERIGAAELLYCRCSKEIQLQGKNIPQIAPGAAEYLDGCEIRCERELTECLRKRIAEYGKSITDGKTGINCRVTAGDVVDNYLWESRDGSVHIVFYAGTQSCVSIPEQIRGLPVTGIEKNAFRGNLFIEEIWLPDTVKTIGDNAFGDCLELTFLRLPKELERVGNHLCGNCPGLRWIVREKGGQTIADKLSHPAEAFFYYTGDGSAPGIVTDAEGAQRTDMMEQEELFTFEIKDREACLIKYKGREDEYGDITIPEVAEGCPVRRVGRSAFAGNWGIGAVRLPWYMEEIEREAFWGCRGMEYLIGSRKLRLIHPLAVGNCESLRFVYIKAENITLRSKAFSQCPRLEAFTFANGRILAKRDAWDNCPKLDSLWFREQLPVWEPYMEWEGSEGLQGHKLYFDPAIGLPESSVELRIEEIPEWYGEYKGDVDETGNAICLSCYRGETEEADVPSYYKGLPVTGLGDELFLNHTKMKRVRLPCGIEHMGKRIFYGCRGLEEIKLPGLVKEVKEESFRDCEKLTEVKLPPGMERVGDYAFAGCTSLERMDFPDRTERVGNYALSGCVRLCRVHLPERLRAVETGMFEGCVKLRHLTFPKGIRSIGADVFAGCTSLQSIWCRNGEAAVALPFQIKDEKIVMAKGEREGSFEANGFYFSLENYYGELILAGIKKEQETMEIPSYCEGIPVTAAGDMACAMKPSIHRLRIPENVEKVGVMAFYGNEAMEEMLWEHQGQEPFVEAEALGVKADTVQLVRNRDIVKALRRNDYPGIVFAVKGEGYEYFPEEGRLVIDGREALPDYTAPASRPWHEIRHKIKRIEVKEGIERIGNMAFADCGGLEEVLLSKELEVIGKMAFSDCPALKAIPLPMRIKSIEGKAFFRCIGMGREEEGFALPDRLNRIGIEAFLGCKGLKRVTIPAGVTYIGARAFGGCTGLERVEIAGKTAPRVIGTNCLYGLKKNAKIVTKFEDTGLLEENSGEGTVYAPAAGECREKEGDTVRWRLYYDGELEITGKGDITDYDSATPPWYEYSSEIHRISVAPGITGIGSMAFRNTGVSEVTLPEGLKTVGREAFAYCHNLENIELPGSVIRIRTGAFRGSTGLRRVFIDSGTEKMTVENSIFDNLETECSVYAAKELWFSLKRMYEGAAYRNIKFVQPGEIVFGKGENGEEVMAGTLYEDGLLRVNEEACISGGNRSEWYVKTGEEPEPEEKTEEKPEGCVEKGIKPEIREIYQNGKGEIWV